MIILDMKKLLFVCAVYLCEVAGASDHPLIAPGKKAIPLQPQALQSSQPGASDICRAGVALARSRQLAEIKLDSEKANVYTISYTPWVGAPPNARVLRCKLSNNAVVLGELKGSKVVWNGSPMPYSLNKVTEELTLRITYSTGKSRTQVFSFDKLKSACVVCNDVSKPATEKAIPGKAARNS